MSEWTREERLAIGRLQRALKSLPKTVRLYVTDAEIIACRQGVPSGDLYELCGGHSVNCGCVLTDMHDDDAVAMEPAGAKP